MRFNYNDQHATNLLVNPVEPREDEPACHDDEDSRPERQAQIAYEGVDDEQIDLSVED